MHEPCAVCGAPVSCIELVNKVGYVYFPYNYGVPGYLELRILCPTALREPLCARCFVPNMMMTQWGYSKYYLADPVPREFLLCYGEIPVRYEVNLLGTKVLLPLDELPEPPVPAPLPKGTKLPCRCNNCR